MAAKYIDVAPMVSELRAKEEEFKKLSHELCMKEGQLDNKCREYRKANAALKNLFVILSKQATYDEGNKRYVAKVPVRFKNNPEEIVLTSEFKFFNPNEMHFDDEKIGEWSEYGRKKSQYVKLTAKNCDWIRDKEAYQAQRKELESDILALRREVNTLQTELPKLARDIATTKENIRSAENENFDTLPSRMWNKAKEVGLGVVDDAKDLAGKVQDVASNLYTKGSNFVKSQIYNHKDALELTNEMVDKLIFGGAGLAHAKEFNENKNNVRLIKQSTLESTIYPGHFECGISKTYAGDKTPGFEVTHYDHYDKFSNSADIMFSTPVEYFEPAGSRGVPVPVSYNGVTVALTADKKIDFNDRRNGALLEYPEVMAEIIKQYPESFASIPDAKIAQAGNGYWEKVRDAFKEGVEQHKIKNHRQDCDIDENGIGVTADVYGDKMKAIATNKLQKIKDLVSKEKSGAGNEWASETI